MALWTQRWILDHDAVTVSFPARAARSRRSDNADASAMPPLSPELRAQIRLFYHERVAPHIRGPY